MTDLLLASTQLTCMIVWPVLVFLYGCVLVFAFWWGHDIVQGRD